MHTSYYTTDHLSFFQIKAMVAFLNQNNLTNFSLEEVGRNEHEAYQVTISDISGGEKARIVDFEKKLQLPIHLLKAEKSKDIYREYEAAILTEASINLFKYNGLEEAKNATMKKIIKTRSPEEVTLDRFSDRNNVSQLARKFRYQVEWASVSQQDTYISSFKKGTREPRGGWEARERLFRMHSGDEYETFMMGLREYALEELSKKVEYMLMFTPLGNGEMAVFNKNIETSEGTQKVALITPGHEIMYFTSVLPEEVVIEIEKANEKQNLRFRRGSDSPTHIPSLLGDDEDCNNAPKP